MTSEPNETPEGPAPDDLTDVASDVASDVAADTEVSAGVDADDGAFPDLPDDPKSRAQRRAERKVAKVTAKAEAVASGSRAGGRRHTFGSLALATGVAALTAAVVCLAYFGYTGINAYVGTGGKAATLRDESIDAAEQAIINIINVSADDIDGWERRIDSSLTGGALKQVKDGTLESLKKEIAAGKRTEHARLSGEVRRAACTEVNVDENRATVLVFSSSTAYAGKDDKGQDVTTEIATMEFLVSVVQVDGVRKVDNIVPLTLVPIEEGGAAGGSGSGTGGAGGTGTSGTGTSGSGTSGSNGGGR
ncbi:MAG: hypothetical protein WAW85_09050 [Gordonia sp. (in: high G+C Gram-positive bacteria)]|uniref:hypothetical protein n=1 Tax=Gordonia sp. (in: high G+C Gram-positive bacteria) TaxID=84139 RepID=UPI003BB50F3C